MINRPDAHADRPTAPLQSRRWSASRCGAFIGVLAAHGFLIVALWWMPPPPPSAGPLAEHLQLVYLPPPIFPTVKAENSPVQRLHAAPPVPPATPSLDPPAQPAVTRDRPSQGFGTGIDWAAEARRAVQAFDIRNDRRAAEAGPTGRPESDDGWRYAWHRPGDQFKTPDGDWIVWIDANCYQVAVSRPGAAPSGPRGRVYCVAQVSDRISSTR